MISIIDDSWRSDHISMITMLQVIDTNSVGHKTLAKDTCVPTLIALTDNIYSIDPDAIVVVEWN
jgi:hypothetical protein